MPHVELIGVYALEVTPSLVEEALTIKGHLHRDALQRQLAADDIRGELESAVLVEAVIHDPDKGFTLDRFGQSQTGKKILAPNDQVAYDERFLSDDGNRIIEFAQSLLRRKRIRFVFWLHFYAPTEILTCYHSVPAPSVAHMPERLPRLITYDPVT